MLDKYSQSQVPAF
uniref:Uncharacterized protein n=1 Tax=Arundo donax TaxID=35708 RepID=A0A0A9HTI2_ARUDO